MIPGSNILNMAVRLIAQQPFVYNGFLSRSENEIGQDITTYKSPVVCKGSVQPVPRTLFQQYGLDFQRNYINVYVSKNILDVARDISGDQIVFNGKTYQCVSETPWVSIDGWDAVLAVQVT